MSRIIASVESDAINHPDFKILLESLKSSSLGLGLTSDDMIMETLCRILLKIAHKAPRVESSKSFSGSSVGHYQGGALCHYPRWSQLPPELWEC